MNVIALMIALLAVPGQEGRIYEELIVPYAVNGIADRAPTTEAARHVINVLLDGRIVMGGEVLDDPTAPAEDRWAKLDAALQALVDAMPKAPLIEGGPEAPTGVLLVRADLVGEFAQVQHILARGAEVLLRRYDLAVGDARNPRWGADRSLLPFAGPQRYLPIELPMHMVTGVEPEELEPLEVKLRVVEPGRKLEARQDEVEPWKGQPGARFRWDLGQRVIEYAIGPRRTTDLTEVQKTLQGARRHLGRAPLVIDPRLGVTVAEAVFLLDAARGLGARDVRFVALWQ